MDNYQKYLQKFPEQTKSLMRAEAAGKLAHAYILYSDSVQVREEYSILLAQIASCPQPTAPGQPCFECSVCRQIRESSYAELFLLKPNSRSRSILIGNSKDDLDTVRWFMAQFDMTSVSPGRRMVGIISDADCLNPSAQNSFLNPSFTAFC